MKLVNVLVQYTSEKIQILCCASYLNYPLGVLYSVLNYYLSVRFLFMKSACLFMNPASVHESRQLASLTYLTFIGVNFIHISTLEHAAKMYREERLDCVPYDNCYPRFAVLVYTAVVEALMGQTTSPDETCNVPALRTLWTTMTGADPDFESNLAMVKDVSIRLHFLLFHWYQQHVWEVQINLDSLISINCASL